MAWVRKSLHETVVLGFDQLRHTQLNNAVVCDAAIQTWQPSYLIDTNLKATFCHANKDANGSPKPTVQLAVGPKSKLLAVVTNLMCVVENAFGERPSNQHKNKTSESFLRENAVKILEETCYF